MTTQAAAALNELCDLISAQIDALEDMEPFLASERLPEFQGRTEKIRVLSEEFDRMNEAETTEVLAETAA